MKLLQELVSQTFNEETDLELKEKALQLSSWYIALYENQSLWCIFPGKYNN